MADGVAGPRWLDTTARRTDARRLLKTLYTNFEDNTKESRVWMSESVVRMRSVRSASKGKLEELRGWCIVVTVVATEIKSLTETEVHTDSRFSTGSTPYATNYSLT